MPSRKERSLSGKVRVPPHNYEAEESVLGSIMIDRHAMEKIADFLNPGDFYREGHAKIFQCIVDLYEKGEPIDVLSVITRLREKKQLERVGGEMVITHLATLVPTAGHVIHYAKIVQKTATLRRLISAASDISEIGFNEEEEIDVILDKAEKQLFAVSQDHKHTDFTKLSDSLEDAFARIDKLHKGDRELRGVTTGLKSLDMKLAGWQKSDLIVLASRPSVGKTTLALDFARQAALAGTPVGLFSLEMSKEQIVDRLLAAHARVDLWRLRTGKLETEGEFDDFTRIGQAMGELSEAPIYIDDRASNHVMSMRTMARRLQAEHGLGLLVIDYLQLMESSRYVDNRVQEVSDISRSLKKLALELDLPILALSQLSRAVEMRTAQRPKLSDLRESGCLAGETLITRADTGERISIRDLAQRKEQMPIPVFAIDEHRRLVIRPMIKVFSSGRKQVYELRTRTGRTIRASANHPFQTISGWQALGGLTVGAHIALPRHLKQEHPENPLSEDELILLAHLIGDGCTVPRQPIHYTSADGENIETVEKTAARLFDIKPRRVRQKNWWHVYLPSPYHLTHGKHNPITQWLMDLGIGLRHAWNKQVPEAVFSCDQQRTALFLHHLWATDGNISWKLLARRKPSAIVYYATTSKGLANDVQQLLLRLGIQSTIRSVLSKKYRACYHVHVQGRDSQINFLEIVGCAGQRGKIIPELLFALKHVPANPNTDIIPKEIWKSIVTAEKERAGLSWRQMQADINVAYSGSSIFKSGVSRERMSRLAVALSSTPLREFASSDVFWDEIVSIEPQEVEEVYDATVPGAHNFVANDMFVHNSIEQDADIVLFLHRQPFEEEERPEAYNVDLLIEKHRNGPTGEIPLHFHSRYVTFSEPERVFRDDMIPVQETAAV